MKLSKGSNFILFFIVTWLSYQYPALSQKILLGSNNNQNLYSFDLSKGSIDSLKLRIPIGYSQTLFGFWDDTSDHLFFTNGCHLFTNLGEKYSERSFLSFGNLDTYCETYGSIASNNIILLPDIHSPKKIYVLFFAAEYNSDLNIIVRKDLYFSIYDLNLKKTSDFHKVCSGDFSEMAYHIKDNGTGYWIALGETESQRIYILDVTESKVSLHASQPFPLKTSKNNCPYQINIQFSPNGDKLAFQHSSCYLALFDFDSCAGFLVGPRLSLSGGISDSPGNNFTFSNDGKWLIVGSEQATFSRGDNPSVNELFFFKTSHIGTAHNPEFKINVPLNFSLGKIFTNSENRIYIFNRFEDNQYIEVTTDFYSNEKSTLSVKRFPFRYSPSINTLLYNPNNMENKCISDIEDKVIQSDIKLFPNPACDKFVLENISKHQEKLYVYIHTYDGNLLSFFLYNSGDEIDISNLHSGVYIIKSISKLDNKQNSFKMIVTK